MTGDADVVYIINFWRALLCFEHAENCFELSIATLR
jgi:hypothetical protein